ncbi:orotidine-5'-phosphate decarboxylase [Brachybacterium sp. EF45031]|uniref:orotidine-5'-phosphate decarboxylase n=1 Tax=Brachybacterium sillae TaxID=2810536 RepID=UPI00217D12C0|nr:orotidine-5'-phosphate decarboxylase [Brachybacterium sillae]MCS6710549.1 orotidine-5'-phosphate decarboxylase [Brachybacterium sillae]
MTAAVPFGARLARAMGEHGPIVAGIDPHAPLLQTWGLPDTADGVRHFSAAVLEAVTGQVAAIKPQAAFFERHGSAGVAALEELLAAARDRGVLTILDAKRGDIGSTMAAYVEATLVPGAPLEADALTVSPYLGPGSLDPALDAVQQHGKGLFVLALTSNPDGPTIQHARTDQGEPVAAVMARWAEQQHRELPLPGENGGGAGTRAELGSVGLVIGATVGSAARDLGLDLAGSHWPILAPGFGAQGAGPAELTSVFGPARDRVLVSVSRSLLRHGPSVDGLRRAARDLRAEYTGAA